MQNEPISLYDEAFAICAKLGLTPNEVRQITITPKEATALVYLRNAAGDKYIDIAADTPATETQTFTISTLAPFAS